MEILDFGSVAMGIASVGVASSWGGVLDGVAVDGGYEFWMGCVLDSGGCVLGARFLVGVWFLGVGSGCWGYGACGFNGRRRSARR